MVHFFRSKNILVDGLEFYNSPLYHLNIEDADNVTVRNFFIHVDVTRQKELLIKAGLMMLPPGQTDLFKYGIPTFPLNTDGIDPMASNVHIHNGQIQNFDDGVAFKPCNKGKLNCECAGGYVHDLVTNFTVGMTIGSVPPNQNINCVKDVLFKDITMNYPLKALYLKSNPGDSGMGLIQNIKYENMFIDRSVWWTLWMGPQQMKQPDGNYMGCSMIYPIIPTCPTNPLVTFDNILFKNITSINGLNPIPGVMIFNQSNPGTNIIFDDVFMSEGEGKIYTQPFITEYAMGYVINSEPIPQFI